MPESQEKLLRKHFLLSREQIEKIDRLAHAKRCSAAEVVRKAIEAYDSEHDEAELNALLGVVEESISEAVTATRATNRRVGEILGRLEG